MISLIQILNEEIDRDKTTKYIINQLKPILGDKEPVEIYKEPIGGTKSKKDVVVIKFLLSSSDVESGIGIKRAKQIHKKVKELEKKFHKVLYLYTTLDFNDQLYTDDKYFHVYIKFILNRITPNKYIYHLTFENALDNILKHGLTPYDSKNSPSSYHNRELYWKNAIFFINPKNISGRLFKLYQSFSSGKCILQINTTGLKNTFYDDPNLENDFHEYIITFDPIPPENIKYIGRLISYNKIGTYQIKRYEIKK